MTKRIYWFISIVLFITFGVILAENDETRLKKVLFSNYDRSTRPVKDHSTPTRMAVSTLIFSLTKVDEANEALTVTLDLGMRWKDEFLTWNSSSYGGISTITVLAESIWIPDVTFQNADEITHIFPSNQRYAKVSSDGAIYYSSMQHVIFQCHFYVNDFPFDVQKCTLAVELWIFQIHTIELFVIEDYEGSTMESIKNHPEWEPLSYKWTKGVSPYSTSDGNTTFYSNIHYKLTLKRRPFYFITTIIFPSYVITSVCLIGLFVPSNSDGMRQEKVTLGLTTLLTMAVILNIATDQIPKSGEGIATLALVIVLELSLASVATVITVIILVIHERAVTREWKIPKRLMGKNLKKLAEVKERKETIAELAEIGENKNNDNSTGEMSKLFKANVMCYHLLEKIKTQLDDKMESEKREQQWCKIFDRVDMFMLVLFQVANIVCSHTILAKYCI